MQPQALALIQRLRLLEPAVSDGKGRKLVIAPVRAQYSLHHQKSKQRRPRQDHAVPPHLPPQELVISTHTSSSLYFKSISHV